MKQHSKLSSEQRQEQEHALAQQSSQGSEQEFATAEELLRYDAARTTVPPTVAERLKESSATLPRPKSSWWKRWFGGGKS